MALRITAPLTRAILPTLLGCLLTTTVALGQAPSTSPGPVTAPSSLNAGMLRAYVPVQRFWSPQRDLSLEELRAAVEGRSDTYTRVLVDSEDPTALWQSLGVVPAGSTDVASPDAIAAAVARSRRVLGLVPAERVQPSLRAMGIDGLSLFGGDRVADLDAWPLTVPLEPGQGPGDTYDPSTAWTLIAGGDVMLDREVHRQAVLAGKGADHPWDGGFARITSRTCCTVDGGNAISTRRQGPRGAVRSLLSSADITIVNHEGPAPDASSYHPSGLVFTFDPELLPGVARAGIDIVSLANNHIRNAGSRGVLQTMRNLRRAGIRPVGAGRDAIAARREACLEAAQVRVCFLAYDAINTIAHAATETRAGAAALLIPHVRRDIRRLRRDGAGVIIVVPHWGTEYVTRVTPQQRRWARAMVAAGADAVLGSHSHVVGPVDFIDGVPVLFSLGDLLFDLPRFEETEEAVVAELTFQGTQLLQVDLHPTVVVDRSQVALLDPARDGKVVLERMRAASKRSD